jgi:phosphate transport system substrate-binding protein
MVISLIRERNTPLGGPLQTNLTRRKTEMSSVPLKSIGLLLFFVLFPLLFFRPSNAHSSDYLTVSGCSISNVGYLTELAGEYERRTGVKVFVRGGGSVVGIEDLRSGKVDFAASCRSKDAGDPAVISFIQVAWDALVFITHPSNPVDSVSLDDVRSIYAGRITNWKQLKGRDAPVKILFSRTKKGLSGVEASIKQLVLGGEDPRESPNIVFVASSGIVEQMVEETPEGFATTGVSSARKRKVKMLKVNGIAPTYKAIVQNRYPFKRPLFLLVPKNPRPEVQKFVDFTLSREGQQFIRSLNIVPVRDVQ